MEKIYDINKEINRCNNSNYKELSFKERGKIVKYIARIRGNDIAFAVKAADRLHNLKCATVANEKFKRKYIIETIELYLDFSPEIVDAVKVLAESLDEPIDDLQF